ncbi:MAG: MFS transporter [Pseudonocardiales bacterium]|nr:MAG: MFS transporter [Pseudonocardiales bacterium]
MASRPGLQVGIAQSALGYVLTSLGAVLVLLARDLDLPAARLAWLSSAFGVGLLVTAAAGPRMLKAGPRPALRAGALGAATGTCLLAAAPSLPYAVAGGLLFGLGGAALVLVTPALVSGPGVAARLTRVTAASSSAAVLGPLAMGGLDALGPSGRLALFACVPPLLLLVAGLTPPGYTGPAELPKPRYGGASEPCPQPVAALQVGYRWSRVVLAVGVEFCFVVWAAARLQDTGVAAATATILGSSFPLGMALGRLAGHRLVDRIPAVPVGSVLTGTATLVIVASATPARVAAGLLLAGIGIATLYPATLADLLGAAALPVPQAASLGALASGAAILTAPALLAGVATVLDLRVAFLITLPLLIALNGLPGRVPSPGPAGRAAEDRRRQP